MDGQADRMIEKAVMMIKGKSVSLSSVRYTRLAVSDVSQ